MLHRCVVHKVVNVGSVIVDEIGESQFAHGSGDAGDSDLHASDRIVEGDIEVCSEFRDVGLRVQVVVREIGLNEFLWQAFFRG